jgi:hypothetical protein
MSKFVLQELNNVNGKITFFKIIEDGVCYWNEFCKTIQNEGIWIEQLDTLISQMDTKANLKSLPKEKYHPYSTEVKGVNGFEFKTRDLRAYGINDDFGNVIIFAGKKNSQDKDEVKFKSIVKRYSGSKK